jgi:hypothetical protein
MDPVSFGGRSFEAKERREAGCFRSRILFSVVLSHDARKGLYQGSIDSLWHGRYYLGLPIQAGITTFRIAAITTLRRFCAK